MACLVLSFQPSNGPDILLEICEWFPPARALAAIRHSRLSFGAPPSAPSDDLDSTLGEDPLPASSGQVVVGMESKYRIVYCLVNGIYVLGITTANLNDTSNNVFELFKRIDTVNQAVVVVAAACRGVDVTPDKLYRKYPELYMALDVVLCGVGSLCLAAILSSIHGDSITKVLSSGIDTHSRARGADPWSETLAQDHQSNLDAFASTSFELPLKTLFA